MFIVGHVREILGAKITFCRVYIVMSEAKVIEENGVKIQVTSNHDNPTNCKTFYNPVMKICRSETETDISLLVVIRSFMAS